MKKILCFECDTAYESDTRQAMLSALYSHYIQAHKSVIMKASVSQKKAWLERFEKEWSSENASS